MEVQVAITMKESLGQNHARNRLSAKSYRCSILEVGEPGDSAGNGITTREILKLSQLCGPGSAICDAGWPTPDCPWSMLVCRSQKKYFRNFNFNFNYRELLSKSATFSLRSFGVVPNERYCEKTAALYTKQTHWVKVRLSHEDVKKRLKI